MTTKSPSLPLLLALICALCAATAQAQTVVNPTRVQFDVSPDHAVTLSDGSPAITRYELRFYAAGASSPLTVTDLGKPAATPAAPTVSVALAAVFAAIPLGGGYTARVVAIGPAGEGVSAPSNAFDHVAPPRPATTLKVL